MEGLILAILAIAFCYFFLQERTRKDLIARQNLIPKVAYQVHIQERTEEAETLDFAVNLYEGEPSIKWKERLEIAYSIAQARRQQMNDLMIQQMAELKKQAAEEAEAKKKDLKLANK